MAKKSEPTFEEAMAQLQEIASNIENNRYGMDELLVKVKEAAQLIDVCRAKLNNTDDEIKKILAAIETIEE